MSILVDLDGEEDQFHRVLNGRDPDAAEEDPPPGAHDEVMAELANRGGKGE